MIDLEREHLRKTYQLCRTGFFILAVSLVPASIMMLLAMVGLLGDPGLFRRIVNSPWNHWVSTVSVWGSLVGTMLLWARWDHKSWQRRTGFLLFMCLVDVILWFMDQSDGQGPAQVNWLRSNLGQALGWAEFALLASLSGDYLVHLGLDQAEDSAKSTRSLAATGAVVWMLQFCESTNWDGGWPLRPECSACRLAALPGFPSHLDDHPDPGDGPGHRGVPPVEPDPRRDGAGRPGPRAAPIPVRFLSAGPFRVAGSSGMSPDA